MGSSILLFLNIGGSEMVLIILVALLLFGGKKLPELARGLGRGIREFKDASESIKRDINDQINNFEKDLEVKDAPREKPQLKQASAATEQVDQPVEESSAPRMAEPYRGHSNYYTSEPAPEEPQEELVEKSPNKDELDS